MGPETACNFILNNYPNLHKVTVTLYGSLALTGKGHLTDRIILDTLKDKETEIIFDFDQIQKHPNTMKFDLFDEENNKIDSLTFYSIGGGSVELENSNLVAKISPEKIYPFQKFSDIKKYCIDNDMSLLDFVYKFENDNIKEHLLDVYRVMGNAVNRGLTKEGELPGGLHVIRKAKQLYNSKEEFEGWDLKELRLVSSYAFAVSEENASGGLIVTAPTCGACGVLPATLFYLKDSLLGVVIKMRKNLRMYILSYLINLNYCKRYLKLSVNTV
jgi:L-serine dehydratase